ncbi:MAG: hypothetical protein PHS60_16950, partial [Zavarzinia sp.]|nr:hypothetical protein [Zavarzinia sp.]
SRLTVHLRNGAGRSLADRARDGVISFPILFPRFLPGFSPVFRCAVLIMNWIFFFRRIAVPGRSH